LGAYVRSATYGSQDLLASPVIAVSSGATITLDIVAANGGGTITGNIENGGDKLASILLVPQFAGDLVAQPAEPGEFELSNIAPGAYLAYAFSNIEDVEFRNPDFIRTLTGGVPVDVEDGKEQKITIPGVVK
jgi:hypothetical protein